MHLFLSVLLPYSRIHSMNRMMLFNFFGWIELNVSWKWLTSMRHSWMQSHFACGDHHWWHLWVTISPITKKLRVECRKVFSIFGCKRCLRQSSRERSTWIHKKGQRKLLLSLIVWLTGDSACSKIEDECDQCSHLLYFVCETQLNSGDRDTG